jgi:hypothetical protein
MAEKRANADKEQRQADQLNKKSEWLSWVEYREFIEL